MRFEIVERDHGCTAVHIPYQERFNGPDEMGELMVHIMADFFDREICLGLSDEGVKVTFPPEEIVTVQEMHLALSNIVSEIEEDRARTRLINNSYMFIYLQKWPSHFVSLN